MTGFASVERLLEDGRSISMRIRSVNARHLELQVRLPAGLDAHEAELRGMIRRAVRRGHVEVAVFTARASGGPAVQLDEVLLLAHVEAFRKAAQRLALAGEPDLNALMRFPGVITSALPTGLDEAGADVLRTLTAEALESFNGARAAEGAALAGELRAGATRLAAMAEEAGRLRREVSGSALDRLRLRLAELAGEQVDVGPERLLTEAALLVARGDVEEELVRLRTHLERFGALLDDGGEVGKPLEFLLQELNREANTLLSKTGGSAGAAGLRLTEVGLAMKVELERAREQVMNLE